MGCLLRFLLFLSVFAGFIGFGVLSPIKPKIFRVFAFTLLLRGPQHSSKKMERNESHPTTVDCAIKSAKVSLSAFSYLFSELIQYSYRKANHINDLHRRLADVGYNNGLRLSELMPRHEKAVKRETQIRQILIFISTKIWKYLFGKPAVLCSTEREDQYLITEDDPLLTKYITTPKNMPGLNCGTFLGGLVEGILDASEFPAKVSTHSVEIEGLRFPRTVILIEFSDKVIERDTR